MRPDRHKQAASRRYQAKVKARGGSAAESTPASGAGHGTPSHHGRMTRGGHNAKQDNNSGHDDLEDDEETEPTSRGRYSRRKIVSNIDRYEEEAEQVDEAEELERGVDRQTMAFEELLLDSDQKHSFDQAAYFRFKSEKVAEDLEAAARTGPGSAAVEDNQHAQKWMEIRLDDLETSLMRLSFADRLCLSEIDQGFYEYDANTTADTQDISETGAGKVSFKAGTPIVPKLVRGEAEMDILIQPSDTKGSSGAATTKSSRGTGAAASAQQTPVSAPGIKQLSNLETRRQKSKASRELELDDLLEQSKRTVVSLRDLPRAQSPQEQSSKILSRPQPTPNATVAADKQASSSPIPTVARKVALPVPGRVSGTLQSPQKQSSKSTVTSSKPPSRPAANLDDEWLDSMLG